MCLESLVLILRVEFDPVPLYSNLFLYHTASLKGKNKEKQHSILCCMMPGIVLVTFTKSF